MLPPEAKSELVLVTWILENWCYPSLAASTGELLPTQKNWSQLYVHGKAGPDLWWTWENSDPTYISYHVWRAGLTHYHVCRRGWPRPTTHQVHIHSFELAHPNTYPIYDLLESMKGSVLWSHSCRISMTWGNSNISNRSFRKGPVLTVYQKSKVMNQTNKSLQWTFVSKAVHYISNTWLFSRPRWQIRICWRGRKYEAAKFLKIFFWAGRLQGWNTDIEWWRNEWNWGAGCEIPK